MIGNVADRETGQPIFGALVKIERGGTVLQGATTGQDGAFVLTGLEAGVGRLVVSLIGYHRYEEEIAFEGGHANAVDIALESNPI